MARIVRFGKALVVLFLLPTCLLLALPDVVSADLSASGPQTLAAQSSPPTVVSQLPAPSKHDLEGQNNAPLPGQVEASSTPGGSPDQLVTPLSSATSPTVRANHDGLDDNDDGSLTGYLWTPPDPQVAIGYSQAVEFVNVIGRVYDKGSWATQGTFTLTSFFGLPAGSGMSDPRILFDAESGRWIASAYTTAADQWGSPDHRLELAVSTTNNALGTWYHFYIPYGITWFPDQPWLGVSNDKITTTANIWVIGGGFLGEQTILWNKSEALANEPTVWTSRWPMNTAYAFMRPAQNMTTGNPDAYAGKIDGTTLHVLRYTGLPPGHTNLSGMNLTISNHVNPPGIPTSGGNTVDAAAVEQLSDAFLDGSNLWFTTTTGCIPAGDNTQRACIQALAISVPNYAVAQNIVSGQNGYYTFYPAARTTSAGDLIVSAGSSGSYTYPQAVIAGRKTSDPAGILSTPIWTQIGLTDAHGRWGDYFGAMRDPSAPACVWTIAEYAKNVGYGHDAGAWGTNITKSSYTNC